MALLGVAALATGVLLFSQSQPAPQIPSPRVLSEQVVGQDGILRAGW